MISTCVQLLATKITYRTLATKVTHLGKEAGKQLLNKIRFLLIKKIIIQGGLFKWEYFSNCDDTKNIFLSDMNGNIYYCIV